MTLAADPNDAPAEIFGDVGEELDAASGSYSPNAVIADGRLHDSPLVDGCILRYRDVQQDLMYDVQNGATIEEAIDGVLLVLDDDHRAAMAELGVRMLMDDLICRGDVRSSYSRARKRAAASLRRMRSRPRKLGRTSACRRNRNMSARIVTKKSPMGAT